MRIEAYHRWINVALLTLMLVAQTASAAHAIDHHSIDHTELCQVFKTADSTSAIELNDELFSFEVVADLLVVSLDSIQASATTSQQRARAPPLH